MLLAELANAPAGTAGFRADRTERGYPVLRGGSWGLWPPGCRSARRQPWLENLVRSCIGCRVCLDAG